MHRSREEVVVRCRAIIDQPHIVLMVEKSNSPTAAYDIVKMATGDETIAKAARWLGVLRRDYPDTYAELTRNVLRHATCGIAQKGKGDEKALCNGPSVPPS